MDPAAPVSLAHSDEQILLCRDVILALRDQIPRAEFSGRVRRMMDGGYQLAYIAHGERAVCAAGFRFEEMLVRGPSMYVDDLVTMPDFRNGGYGGRMIDWLLGYAREKGCREVHLDSGVQRFDAHRFYMSRGFRITSHHFAIQLPGA